MKKLSVILASLVLFTSVSFASSVKQDNKSKAKTEKKGASKEKKAAPKKDKAAK